MIGSKQKKGRASSKNSNNTGRRAQIIVTSCSRRSLELEQLKDFLVGNGYSFVSEDFEVSQNADLILHSTCAFTTAAEDFAFETLRRIQKEKKPSAKVVVFGCLPEINPNRLSKVFEGATFGPRSYEKLNDILKPRRRFEEFPRPNTLNIENSFRVRLKSVKGLLSSYDGSLQGLSYLVSRMIRKYPSARISRMVKQYNRGTFYIQIQEGCPCNCTYCAIRYAVKELRSKPVQDIMAELEKGLEQGYHSFYFVGDSAGAYGLDIGENLGKLLKRVLERGADFSLNLTDISPVFLHLCFDEIRMLCGENRISSLYIPVQSANPRILKLMGRNCDMVRVRGMLLDLKTVSSVKIGTSIIVGFPSETLDELKSTIGFCEEIDFDWVWCHSFSARPDTVAANLPNQLSAEEIFERSRIAKSRLRDRTLITTAEDSRGSRSCQG